MLDTFFLQSQFVTFILSVRFHMIILTLFLFVNKFCILNLFWIVNVTLNTFLLEVWTFISTCLLFKRLVASVICYWSSAFISSHSCAWMWNVTAVSCFCVTVVHNSTVVCDQHWFVLFFLLATFSNLFQIWVPSWTYIHYLYRFQTGSDQSLFTSGHHGKRQHAGSRMLVVTTWFTFLMLLLS